MKKPGLFAASASASAAAASAYCSSHPSCAAANLSRGSNSNLSQQGNNSNKSQASVDGSVNKFAPRFDGLRFIETLVTAHR